MIPTRSSAVVGVQTKRKLNLCINMNTKIMKAIGNRAVAAVFCGVIASGLAPEARAGNPNLVTDGTFQDYTGSGPGQLAYNSTLTYWSVPLSTYNFLFLPGTADKTGAPDSFGGYMELYGPQNSTPDLNGLPATDPGGSHDNFVALDSTFEPGALSQTITGLTKGDTYAVTFYWAGAQQATKMGATTDELTVSLGAQSMNTTTVSVPQGGFSGWMAQTMDFTASSASEVLSFLASGSPSGAAPPFPLVGDVAMSLTTNPPPSVADASSTATLFGFSTALLALAAWRYRRECRH